MFSAYFWFEYIGHFCSICTFLIICIHLIITAIKIDRKREAKRELTEWLKEKDNDAEQMEDRKDNTTEG